MVGRETADPAPQSGHRREEGDRGDRKPATREWRAALAAVALHWLNGLLTARRRISSLAATQQTETQGKTP